MAKKKILAIMGSPRNNRNTNQALDFLLQEIDKEIFQIKKVYLNKLNINPCTGCDYCGHKEGCSQKDDMIELYKDFDNSHIIILAAPLYFNSINGLTKNMIDRCQKYWSLKYSLGGNYKRGEDRVGIFVSVGGAPYTYDQFNGAFPVIDFFFKAINVEYKGNYLISDTDKVAVKDKVDIIKDLLCIGRNILNMDEFHIHK